MSCCKVVIPLLFPNSLNRLENLQLAASHKISKQNWCRCRSLPILAFSIVMVCNPLRAYNWSNDYGVDLTAGYHDNIDLSVDDEIDTSSGAVGVFADMEGTTEISSIRLALALTGTTYSDSSLDDETAYNLSLDTSNSGERIASFFSLLLDREATRETEQLDSEFDARDGTRDSVTFTPSLSYEVDETNSIVAGFSFQDVSYDTNANTDYTDKSISLSWVHQLNEASSISTNFQFAEYDPDDDDTSDTNSVNVGYDYRASEATSYYFSVGYTKVDEPDGSSDGGTGAFAVNHQTDERNNFSLSLSKDYQASGDGDVSDEDRLNLGWNHELSERAQFTLSTEVASRDDTDYYSFEVGSSYQYTPETALSASYRYRGREEDSDDANSSSILFSLSYSPI